MSVNDVSSSAPDLLECTPQTHAARLRDLQVCLPPISTIALIAPEPLLVIGRGWTKPTRRR